MTTDDRLKALYRASSRGAGRVHEGDVEAALGRSGWPDEENTPLDRIAASAAHADVLRVVMALEDDAKELSRAVSALLQPARSQLRRPGAARTGFALAAGVGAAALLIAGLGRLPSPPSQEAAMGSEVILSASFDGPGDSDSSPQEPQAIFGGGFDS